MTDQSCAHCGAHHGKRHHRECPFRPVRVIFDVEVHDARGRIAEEADSKIPAKTEPKTSPKKAAKFPRCPLCDEDLLHGPFCKYVGKVKL